MWSGFAQLRNRDISFVDAETKLLWLDFREGSQSFCWYIGRGHAFPCFFWYIVHTYCSALKFSFLGQWERLSVSEVSKKRSRCAPRSDIWFYDLCSCRILPRASIHFPRMKKHTCPVLKLLVQFLTSLLMSTECCDSGTFGVKEFKLLSMAEHEVRNRFLPVAFPRMRI